MNPVFRGTQYLPNAGPPPRSRLKRPICYVQEMACPKCGPVRRATPEGSLLSPKDICLCGQVREVKHVGYSKQPAPDWAKAHEPRTGMMAKRHDDLFRS
jgi:hypothetical protein